MTKIAFFDIDGTILPLGNRKPSDKTVYALNKLQENEVILCMATGRSVLSMPRFDEITFDVFMTFNGSYCFNEKEVIHKNPLEEAEVLQILENTKEMNRAMSLSNVEYLVTNGTDEDLEQYFQFGGEPIVIVEDFEKRCHDEIYQVMLSCKEHEYDRVLKGTKHSKIAAWWDRAVDIIPLSSGKGIAVEKILEYYGLSKEEAIAFGDGSNDIDMLKAVGTGIAMGNAKEEVKAFADVICESVENDGIYYCCKNMGLI